MGRSRAPGGRPPKTLHKVAAFLLLFSFITSPFLVQGQESEESTVSTLNSSPAVEASAALPDAISFETPTLSPEIVEEPPSEESATPMSETLAEEGLMSLMSGEPAPTSVELSRKTIESKFHSEPDPVTGSLVYEYPLILPPGRAGLQPSLSLIYSSQPGSDVNTMGYGWTVNTPYIQRINKTGTGSLYSEGYFLSSLDGELVQLATSSESFAPKVERGQFNQYQYASSTYWVIKDKFGTTYSFGTTSAAQQTDPNNSAHVFTWLLEEVVDRNGNSISYEYAKDKGTVYPYLITYAGNASTTDAFQVEFLREARIDVATSTEAGFAATSAQRINEIQVKVDGEWVKKYVISYTTGTNGFRSVPDTIVESGRDIATATTTLPAINFDYLRSGKGWTESADLDIPAGFTDSTSVADINGDALIDILYSSRIGANATNTAYINNTAGWTASTTWTLPLYFFEEDMDQGVRLADVNGDYRTDIVQSFAGVASTTRTYLNTGSGWSESAPWDAPTAFLSASSTDLGVRLTDVNGDGLVDILKSMSATSSAYLNTGSGWSATSTWSVPLDFVKSDGSDNHVRLEDINGDNMTDILQSYDDGTDHPNKVYVNTGTGWVLDSQWVIPVDLSETFAPDAGVRFADVNNDDLTDVVQAYSNLANSTTTIYINTGKGWLADPEWGTPVTFATDEHTNNIRLADVNGDGMLDILDVNTAPGKIHISNSRRGDTLSKVTYPEGGSASFVYRSSQEFVSSGNLLSPALPTPINTLAGVGLFDGINTVASTTYSYRNGLLHFNNVLDRRFAGFGTIISTDNDGNETFTYYHQGNSTATSTGEHQDVPSKIGSAYRVESYDDESNLSSKDVYKWDNDSLSAGRNYVKLTRETHLTYDGDSDHRDKAISYTYNSENGNETAKTAWGEVTAADDGSFTDIGTDLVVATTTYASSTTAYLVGFPATKTLTPQSGTKERESRYYYDSQALGDITLGNLTKEERWVEGSTYASTTRTYNVYGLVTSEYDPRSKSTSYSYDSENLYPTTVTNAVGNSVSYQYDYSSGNIATTTDSNGASSATRYDGLDRPLTQLQSDVATSSSLVVATDYLYTDTALPSVRERKYLSAGTTTDAYFYFDGLGRLKQQRIEAEDSSDFVVRDYTYTDTGLLWKESLPYFKNGSGKTSATNKSELYTTYTYDSAGRVIATNNSLGVNETTHDDWKVAITNVGGQQKDMWYDAHGNLNKVTEYLATTTHDTQYEYNSNGNLTKLTDASGNVRNFTYDGRGLLLVSQDLHAVADTTYGTSTYTYDLSGNKSSEADPKGQIINFTHDGINRLLTEDFTGQAGTEKVYVYDTCAFGLGRLCSATTATASTTYAYDSIGRPSTETRRIGDVFTQSYTYDRQGNILTLTYPDNSTATYTYNGAGQLESISYVEYGSATTTSVVADFDYGPTGAVTYQENGNGTETFSTFNDEELYRLTTHKTIGPGEDLMMLLGGGGESVSSLMAEGQMQMAEQSSPITEERRELTGLATPTSKTFSLGRNEGKEIYATQFYSATPEGSSIPSGKSDMFTTTGLKESAVLSFVLNGNTIVIEKSDAKLSQLKNATGSPRIEITKGDGYIKKDIVLESAPPELQQKGDYEISFKLTSAGTTSPDLLIDGRLLSTEKEITSMNGAAVLMHGKAGAYILPTFAEDRTPQIPGHRVQIPVRYESRSDGIYLTKVLSFDWLENAEYPVRADFTVSSYPGIGDGHVETYPYPGSWSTQHADTTGQNVDYTAPSMYARVGAYNSSTGYLTMTRSFLPVDTSVLPDNAVISSSTLNVYVKDKWDSFNDSYGYVTVYEGTQASVASIINTDIDTCGATTSPTKGSSDVDITGATVNAYAQFPLNSTGRGWISKTGYTKLCLREGHDATNNEATNNSNSWNFEGLILATSETAGTSMDPYLEVVYSIPNTTPETPSNLRTEAQTSPTNVIDLTPEFTAQFNDPDSGDLAASYKVQVSTSASDWSSPVWDSSKVTLGQTILSGEDSLPIAYGGTALTHDAGTYYWRIKFWDDEDSESSWSDVASFSMADDGGILQDFSFTYDLVGNIVELQDNASSTALRNGTYAYDDLNRLTQAVQTTETETSADWYDPSWPNRIQVTSNNAAVDGAVGNLYVSLATLPSHFHSNVLSTGCDIRMTTADAVTEVATDLVYYNSTTDTGELYFDSSGMGTTTDTSWYLYYGNGAASCPAQNASNGAQNVWSNKKGVWHFNETSGTRYDSTSGNNDLAVTNSVGTASGKIGEAADFESSSSQYLSISDASQTGLDLTGSATVSGWVKLESIPTAFYAPLFVKDTGQPQRSYAYWFLRSSGPVDKGCVYNSSDGTNTNTTGNRCVSFSSALTTGTWYHVAYVFNAAASSWELFLNGVSQGSINGLNSSVFNSTAEVRVGRSESSTYFDGLIDQLQVSDSALSSGAVVTEYNNVASSTFWTIGSYENSSTSTSATVHTENITYTPLGNILTKSDQGAYTYGGTGYANPHAVTSIATSSATSTYAYDNNGNATSAGTFVYAWDYNNLITSAGNGLSTTTYAYDHTGARVKQVAASLTTFYPSTLYTATASTSEKNIYAGGQLVASISNVTGSTTSYWNHTDHLGGGNITSNAAGIAIERILYRPFGAIESDVTTTGFSQSKKYIGQEYDAPTQLSYLNARYMAGARGQFLSQDPVFLEAPKAQDLSSPQNLNSYSYGSNNPILNKDTSGRASYIWNSGAGMSGVDVGDPNTYYEQNDVNLLSANSAYMQSVSDTVWKYPLFAAKEWKNQDWDFYNKDREFYFFEGGLLDKESFGNVHYGYVGSAASLKSGTLLVAGGAVQVITGGSNSSWSGSNYDQPHDQINIQKGIDSYNRSINSASKSLSAASKAVSLGNLSAAVRALTKALKALKNK